MRTVNVLDAKNNLSRLIEAVKSGAEDEIIIARNGKPAARLVPLVKRKPIVLGILKGKVSEADIKAMFTPEIEAEVLRLFEESANAEPDLAEDSFVLDPSRIKLKP